MRDTRIQPHQHGTNTGYAYKCRCDECKRAHREHAKKRYQNEPEYRKVMKKRTRKAKSGRREYISSIKLASGCVDCGFDSHPDALEFDHLPGTVKLFNIGDLKLYSLKRLHAEMEKCEIICANCHRVRTATRRKK